MKDRLFSLVLVIFLCLSLVPTLGFVIKDIYEDHTFTFVNKPLEINHTVNVHENATLTIQPGVKIRFSAEGGFNILGQLVANGSETLPIDVDSAIDLQNVDGSANIFSYNLAVGFHILRLVSGNGFSTGRLEVFHEGIWGTVCSDWWSQVNSDVACRQLGFSTGTFTTDFSDGRGQIWLDDVRCTKADHSLRHCSHRGFGIHNCEHNQDVGLRCTIPKLNEKPQDRSRGLFHFGGKRKSSLKYVRIQGTQQHQAKSLLPLKFSFFKRSAIVCEGKCPYVHEVDITGFAVAVEVLNYGEILLRNINILNCLYGVMALNGYLVNTEEVSYPNNVTDIFRLEKMTIRNTRVGIMLANHSLLPIELKEIAITNCFSGVSISKTMFTNVKMTGLRLDTGVNAVSSTTLTLGHLRNVDLCNKHYRVYNKSFPVEIVHSTYELNVNPCSMVFATSAEYGLSAFVSVTDNINLRISDYNSSKILFDLSNDSLSKDFIMDWQSSAVVVEIQFKAVRYAKKELKIFLSSRLKNAKESKMLVISDVTIQHFTAAGITFNVNQDTAIIKNSVITSTSANCISASGKAYVLRVANNTFQHNGNYSVKTSMLLLIVKQYSLFIAERNMFQNNNCGKIITSVASPQTVRYVSQFDNNDFLNNTCENLVDMEYRGYSCPVKNFAIVSIFTKNRWTNNRMRTSSAVALKSNNYWQCSPYKLDVSIMENEFLNNTGKSIIEIHSRWLTTLTLHSNYLQGNVLEKNAIAVSLEHYSNQLSLLHNKGFNNKAESLFDILCKDTAFVDVRGNALMRNEVDRSILNLDDFSSNFKFTRNILIGNVLHRRAPLPYYDINYSAALICSGKLISANENFFENPQIPLEIILTPIDNRYEIDGRYNWWGTSNGSEVILRIFDFRHRNYLPRLNFSPFLASANLSDVIEGQTSNIFRNGSVLGGLLTENIVLVKDQSPYTVTRDVIIHPNASLTIQKGVQIKVLPNLGFIVYGKFDILGERNNPTTFDIATTLKDVSNFGHYSIRLVNGSKPWEGIVEVLYNNTWGAICDDGGSYSNRIVLCKQLGFKGFTRSYPYTSTSDNTRRVWWKNLRCNHRIHDDISSCPFQGWGVSCNNHILWAVQCHPGYWRGIRFRETAKASQITHVKFERGGDFVHKYLGSYTLNFDVLRQVIRDAEILDSVKGGIRIAFLTPGLDMRNILIHEQTGRRHNSFGIETSSSLICYNCSVIAKEWGVYFRETGMESFIDNVGVKRIDSLIFPDILLRKKHSLCEQNKSIVVGKEDMKIILLPKTFSKANVECFFNLTLLSEATIVTEIILSSNETFSITATHSKTSSDIHIAASQNDTYNFGPGNLTLRYRRKAHAHGTTIRLVIFSTKGSRTRAMKKVVGGAVLFGGSLINNNYGIRLDRNSVIEYLKIQNITMKVFYYGIYSYYSSSNVSIDNCIISDGSTVILVHDSSQRVSLKNSELSDCSRVVYLVGETDMKFVEMENCIVRRMSSHVIASYYKNLQQTQVITLRRCILIENQGILYTFSALYSHIEVTECNISRTKFNGFEIDLYQSENDLTLAINNSTFSGNSQYLFLIRKHNVDTSRSSILFKKNVFVNNSLPSGYGIIYLLGKGIRTATTHINQNTFMENKCSFLIKVDAQSNWMPLTFSVTDNIIEHNKGVPFITPTYTIPAVYSYSIGLFGCAFANYDIRANVFNNKLMEKELFIGRTCGSNYIPENNYIDGTLNYWGTSSVDELSNKIFHSDNWNDRPEVRYLPAAATRNLTSIITSKAYANQSQIGGYINISLLLTMLNSPYVVMNDLTISENTTLYIQPGVHLYFKPNIGLLILGNIVAKGKTNEKIKFCSLENRCKNRQRKVRLVSEDREYIGKLEIFVDDIWQSVCADYFTSKDGIVACRQLGYGRYINHHRRYSGLYTGPRYKVSFKCRGNETSFSNCKHQTVNYCSKYYMLFIDCESDFKWGNVRIIHPNIVNSTGYKDKQQKEQSSLKNIFIHDAGILHDHSVSSIQVIERSPFLAHIHMSDGSNGIEIIAQKHTMELEQVTVESSLDYPAISILGNLGSVSISRALIKGRKQHGIAIASIKNMSLLQPFLGQHDLCGPVQKVYVHDQSYVFLNQRNKIKAIVCRMEFVSPVNKKIHFRLLTWTKSSYSVTIYNSDRSTKFAGIQNGNIHLYLDKDFVIPSSSFVIEADISTLNRFMAKITVTDKTGERKDEGNSNIYVGESSFQETSGAAVHYTSDALLPARLEIRRCHVALVGNDGAREPIKPSIEMVVRNNDSIEISNNVFTGSNRGGIHIYLFGRQEMVSIINNIISGIRKGSEAVHVAVVAGHASSKLLMAGNLFKVNDIIYPHDLVNIKNVAAATITDNVCYDNTARSTLKFIASSKTNNVSFITRNALFLNKGRSNTVQILSYGREVINENYFSNPSNQFELSTLSSGFSDTVVNASYNWWGNVNPDVIMRKIMDKRRSTQLPHVIYQPFLQSPTPIFATGLCSFGWIFLHAKCYYNLRSAQNFQKSKERCKEIGGSMLSSQVNQKASMVLKKLHDKLAYGTKLSIWIDVFTKQDHGCWVFDGAMREISCDLARSTICEKKPSGHCINDCSLNGVCLGQTCKCNGGWEGADCSSYHCKDLGNCGSYGDCLGPNQCKCRLGWMGRGCTISYCPTFKTCRSCHSRKGCGWCDSTRTCSPGTAYGTDIGHCQSWFYHNCISVGRGPSCSSDIKVIDCNTRLCNVKLSQYSKRSCQQCKDLENCYHDKVLSNDTLPKCYDWNEIKCPKGFVQKNYDDSSRINQVEPMSNVKLINSDDLVIYGCPVKENLIIVAKKDRIHFKRKDVISSTQAEGIFHKIQDITLTDQHAMMNVIPARLEDVISYSDFDQEVPLQRILDQDLLENSPDDSLLQDILSGASPINKTIKVHTLFSGPDSYVYKCLAKTYTTDNDEEVTTLFVVFPMTSINGNLSIGNVIVGSSSNGFLETVKEIVQDEGMNFIYTELTTCKSGFLKSARYIALDEATSSCLGGDNLLGLKITEKDTNVTVGDIIVGRDSGSFFGKVLSFYTENGNYFAEVMPISTVNDGNVKEEYNVSDISQSRRKRAVGSLTTRANFRMARNVKIGSHLTVSGGVQFNADVKINLHTSYSKPKSVGVVLSGSLKLDLNCDFNPSSSYSVSQSRKLINNKQVGRFCIPLVRAVCIPGVFRLDIGVSASASALAASSLSASLTSKYSISAGGIWRKGHGVEQMFDEKGSAIPSFKARMEKNYASFLATLTPTFQVHWPSVTPRKLKHQTITVLERILDVKRGPSIPSLFVFTLTPSITTSLDAKFCTEKCPDAGQNIEANFRGRLSKVDGSLMLNIGSYNKNWNLFRTSLYEYARSECFLAPVKVPCCITKPNGKPGRVDPITGQCEEECDCYPGGPEARKGKKMKDGACKCDICPDNSVKRKRSEGKPECPCLCKDGTEKEMNSDGSCQCACTCDDGSKDIIAWDGSCPCECSCNGYEKSTLGPFGCKCEDKCPVCKDGEKPIWIDRKCLCRKRNSCGVPPVCVNGRKGTDCNQANCSPCQGCSGNGVCVTDSSCRSKCSCRRRWQGQCCERRRPVRSWGDPHLQTLDGMEFDYFGIGEYWNCKSVVNDFGMQVRFYGYKGASLTGTVALKVAENIVTITTLAVSSYSDKPRLRINGALQNFSNLDPQISFANDSIKLNIFNPDNGTESDGVTILAFQFKSGVTVTVEAEYSPVMSRHYLNVNFIPTAAFTKTTEGLCGFMDDNETNDLIGPKGEQYNNTIQFSESWRITTNHNGSGLMGSWNWNSSNFHTDDLMDLSYTDEGHTPMYSLDNFSLKQVNEAKRVCQRNGLENVLLNNCAFDILMTNDTSFADQQSLKIGCPNDCTGKGLCKNATCTCLDGWSGDDCTIGSCGNCSRGSCVEGFCKCDTGWEGAECDRKATCFAVDNCTSEVHGMCKTTDVCECNVGYTGPNCSIVAICNNVFNCSSNGDCIAMDVCKCYNGYHGSSCNKPSCESLGYCSGNGRCIAFDTCECNIGWSGPSCSIPDCSTLNHCSNKGECVGPNICKCFGGFQGNDCTALLDCSHLNNCSGNGVCEFNNAATDDTKICSCYLGYAGSNCSQYDCANVNDCSGNGTCVQPNLCSCNVGFAGETCANFSCETRNRCSGNGICVGDEECNCNKNWSGLSCETPTCDDVNNCSLNGLCVFPNKCECFAEYDGRNCTERVEANLNSPMFINTSYFAVAAENRAKGFVILRVYANDTDMGRSGMVSYSIETESAKNFVMINHYTGEISVASDGVFDYEIHKYLTFVVKAADNGVPIRSTGTNVTIVVTDENDNCPEFSTPPRSYKYPVRILAKDDDDGDNGRIRYSITDESDPDRKFFITSNGTLLPRTVLQPGAYLLTIVAEDMGAIPCARKLSLTIVVDHIVSAVVLPTSTTSSSTELFPTTTVAKQSSSSVISSAIVASSLSLIAASTRALRPSSSYLPSSVAERLYSTVLSSTPLLQFSPSPRNGTSRKVYPSAPLSFVGLQSSSSPLTSANAIIESSSLSRNSIAVHRLSLVTSTLLNSISSVKPNVIDIGSTKSLRITSQLYPTRNYNSATWIMSTHITENRKLVSVKLKILNIVFLKSYRDKNSVDYKRLRRRVEATLKIVFEKITGYLTISDVDFDEGSVIAEIQTKFSLENTKVSTSTLARAVVNATDENGNLGDFQHSTSFLQQQINPTKPPTQDDEGGDDAIIGTAVGIGSAGFICVILALCLVCYFINKRTKIKHRSEHLAIEMH